MTQTMREPTLRTLGLGTVLDMFKKGRLPADPGGLVEEVFGSNGRRGSLVISGANGIVGAGKAMQLGSRLHPFGVPVVALAGKTHAARVGVSILNGLGLSELVAQRREGYVQRAVALARDWRRLDALRKGLRPHMQASPLMDGPGLARRLEHAYRDMWHDWCISIGTDIASVANEE